MITELLFALALSSVIASCHYGYIAYKKKSIFGLLIAMNLLEILGQICIQFLSTYNVIVIDQTQNLMSFLLN